MHHDQFAAIDVSRALSMNEHLDPGLGLDVSGLDRKAALVQAANGEIRDDGQ